MRATAVVVAILSSGCGPEALAPVTAPARTPDVLDGVGASPRVYADIDLQALQVRPQLTAAFALLPAGVAATCGIDIEQLARPRIAVGEPLRIVAELEGKIDAHAITCALGERASLVDGTGVTVRDHPGGVSIEYQADREHAVAGQTLAAELRRRCPDGCAVARLGPASRAVWVEARPRDSMWVRVSGPGLGGGAAAFADAVRELQPTVPALRALEARADHGDLVVTTTIKDLPGATALGVAFREHLLGAYSIPSSSMEPTLHSGDHLFAIKGPLLGAIQPGDVLVYRSAEDNDYVKRYIAGAGQLVEQTKRGIEIDGRSVPVVAAGDGIVRDEDGGAKLMERAGTLFRETLGAHRYITIHTGPARGVGSWTVPAGELFFLGDNRNNSNDSRFSGTTPAAQVKGRAAFLWWAMRDGVPDWDRIGTPIE